MRFIISKQLLNIQKRSKCAKAQQVTAISQADVKPSMCITEGVAAASGIKSCRMRPSPLCRRIPAIYLLRAKVVFFLVDLYGCSREGQQDILKNIAFAIYSVT